MKQITLKLKTLCAIALAAASLGAQAESTFVTSATNAPLNTSARLDFRVVVPNVLFLRVGAGTNLAANATINELVFTVPGASVGNSTPIASTGGDDVSGAVTARVISNNGSVTLSAATTGQLTNASSDQLSWLQFNISPAVLTSAVAMPHPTLVNGGSSNVTLTAVGRVVNRDALWTFSYANSTTPAQGSYTGRITYTATQI